MDDIYFKSVLHKKIIIYSKYLDENIDNYIHNFLKNKIEGKCVDEGYIKPDSIKIIKKSIGALLGSRFTGDITYNILYTADISNPVIGNIIDCKVKFINKLGILGNNGPITIIVSKQFHDSNDLINKIKEGDIIKVEVIAKKFYLNDTEIKIVAKLWDENKKEIISSDLTPINNDEDEDEYDKIQNLNNITFSPDNENIQSDEEEEEEYEDEDEEDEEEIEADEEENVKVIKIGNPDENINADEIELDDEYDEDEEDNDMDEEEDDI